MAQDPNKLFQFWQELKRRKVTRVITVYAASAFAILELLSIVIEPLSLPDWTLQFALVFLCIGFIITIIFSWIYDIHPEGGIVKTEPAHKVEAEDIPSSSGSWKIASYVSFVVIVGLIALNILPRVSKEKISEALEKSIAVLPFINDSPEETEMFFINGTMESILDNLCKIEDLRVVSRTSTEQYRDNPKSIPTVGEEMDVSYVIEGSGLKHGDNIRLAIQLIDAVHDRHIWSRTYDRKTSEIFELQSEIARLVADEIEAVITPEEKQLIDKAPTTSLMANEYYQRGREEFIGFLLNVSDRDALIRAREYGLKALEYDPTFAKACAGVAMTLYSRLAVRGKLDMIYSEGYLENNAFDTVLYWANEALHIDNQLPEAYFIRGNYYHAIGQREKAEQDYRKAIQLNPNYWEAYFGLGNLYSGIDYSRSLEYFQKASTLVRGPELSYILMLITQTYILSGLTEKAESLTAENVNLTHDSLVYFMENNWIELYNGNMENQHNWLTRAYTYDSKNPIVLSYLAESYINMGNFEEGLKYYRQSYDINHSLNRIDYHRLQRMGYAFSLAGQKEEADFYLDRAEEICKIMIRLNRPYAQIGNAQYDLALVYAFRGEKSKAMEILRNFHQRSYITYTAGYYMQWDPMLDSLRDDPEFQQIADDVRIKSQAERERIRQWLEDNDML